MIPLVDFASGLAVLVSLAAIIGFILSRRQAAIEEGKHLESIQQLRRDLDLAHQKIREIEDGGHGRDVTVGEIKADVKHLLDAVKRIEAKLDEHILRE